MVTPTPKAIDSPADPAVWTILFSKMVAGRNPNIRLKARNSVIDSTATGIEAETVIPTFSTRYSDDVPKTIPSSAPTITACHVNSGMRVSSATYGLFPPDVPALESSGLRLTGTCGGAAIREGSYFKVQGSVCKAGDGIAGGAPQRRGQESGISTSLSRRANGPGDAPKIIPLQVHPPTIYRNQPRPSNQRKSIHTQSNPQFTSACEPLH